MAMLRTQSLKIAILAIDMTQESGYQFIWEEPCPDRVGRDRSKDRTRDDAAVSVSH